MSMSLRARVIDFRRIAVKYDFLKVLAMMKNISPYIPQAAWKAYSP